jgi:Fibronectin type III domain
MPTISQLPATSQVTAADQLPISQGGSACSVDVGSLLATTQPAIMIATGSLFGRTSLGQGGPEPVTVGTGLLLNSTTLTANGTDHAGFPSEGALSLTDQAVVNSAGSPKLLPLSLLRGLFSPGSNVAIDENGTISAAVASGTSGYSITALPTVATISAGDLVAISQAGTDHTITYANFVDGQTIDEAQAADAASDADTFLVAQNSNVMTRQTLAAMWAWLNAKLVSYQMPTLELTTNTTLSATAHNGHMLICSQTLTLTPAPTAMGSGFSCTLLNVSDGNITLGSGITTSSGNASVPPGQMATISCATYSGGTLVYAWISGATSSPAVPGQISGISAGLVTASSVALSWTPLSPSPASYTVQYRINGTTAWSQAAPVSTSASTVAGLLAATSYDFTVFAVSSAGSGTASAIVTVATTGTVSAPGQVTGLTTSNPTVSAISLAWSQPVSGGAVNSYTVQYRVSGTASWAAAATSLTTASFTMTGLSAATSYDFQVLAANTAGTGPASAVATASTAAASGSVTSITWNMVPSGSYTHGAGAIGVNAQVTPGTAPVQFGFSTSATVPPTSWTAGNFVNTNLWGAYVNAPSVAGSYYAWCEGTDGSEATVYPNSFIVT